jgi:hypothetical protein
MMTQESEGRGVEHPLVRDYLERLRAESARLSADQGRELYDDIADHLGAALGADATEAEVRERLEKVGTPALLVDEAGGAPTQGLPPAKAAPGKAGGVEAAAVITLFAAELAFFLVPVAALAWVAGLVLLAISRYWTGREKLSGFLALGTGFPVALFVVGLAVISAGPSASCSNVTEVLTDGTVVDQSTRCTGAETGITWVTVVAWVLTLAYLAFQVVTAWRLLRSRR